MKLLFLNWKDIKHAQWGGAEVFMHELCKRFVKDGHEVTLLTALYPGSSKFDQIDGINVIRVGTNRYFHNFAATLYFIRNLRGKFDYVIDIVNTSPYFASFFDKKAKHILFFHQLAREVWFYETKPPLSWLGYYLLEPFANRLLSLSKTKVVTVSESSKQDIMKFGFKENRISIISEGTNTEGLKKLEDAPAKYKDFTLLYFGSIRPMKRPFEVLKAFKFFYEKVPTAKLIIAGRGDKNYRDEMKAFVKNNNLVAAVAFEENPSDADKIDLMRKSHVLCVTSVKEGWGIVVIEAGINGTPAVVYNVDGLRDAVKDGVTGLVVANGDILALAKAFEKLITDPTLYKSIRKGAFDFNNGITFDRSYNELKTILSH